MNHKSEAKFRVYKVQSHQTQPPKTIRNQLAKDDELAVGVATSSKGRLQTAAQRIAEVQPPQAVHRMLIDVVVARRDAQASRSGKMEGTRTTH